MTATVDDIRAAFAEIEADFNAEGIRITVERTLSFTNPEIKFGLRIERERKTANGRQGKPTPLVLLINNPDERPADMLRMLAKLLDAGATA